MVVGYSHTDYTHHNTTVDEMNDGENTSTFTEDC